MEKLENSQWKNDVPDIISNMRQDIKKELREKNMNRIELFEKEQNRIWKKIDEVDKYNELSDYVELILVSGGKIIFPKSEVYGISSMKFLFWLGDSKTSGLGFPMIQTFIDFVTILEKMK